jgi:hypothetical protein
MAQFRKDTHQYLNDGKTIFEVAMLADQYGNLVGAANPTGTAIDAFGRARISNPLTLFDSSNRYRDNGLWATSNSAGTTYEFNANSGLIELNVTTSANAEIIRETTKVFAYQPGKSLLILNTFVFNEAKTNLRQRVGYFGAQNGYFLEQNGTDIYLVERSYVNGSVNEIKISKSNWNMDTLDGTGPSLITLNLSKAQIFWIDIEWLGVGTVRCGFIINGKMIHCHSFHHANINNLTYITTASLPLRYEIKNIEVTSSNSSMKQICSSVVSEGGYELHGQQQSVGTAITNAKTLTTAGTFYPVVSIRLKSTAMDAIVILSAVSLLGAGNNINYNWCIIEDATVTTVSWTDAGANSSVEYTISGTAITGGKILASGYFNSSTQSSIPIQILRDILFRFQLQRNSLANTVSTLSIAVAAGTDNSNIFGSLDWEEISR